MTAKNLSSLTQDVIDAYGNTAHNVILVYRASGERVASFVEQRWEQALERTREQIVPEVRDNARYVQNIIGGYYSRGLDFTSQGAETVVNQLVGLAGQGVRQVAANASRLEAKTGLPLDRLGQAATPVAAVAAKLATQIESSSTALACKVTGSQALPKRAAKQRKGRSTTAKSHARKTA